ncbi:MAG: hypothetical protein ACKVP0_17660 [Pirellulaceae bacterium]
MPVHDWTRVDVGVFHHFTHSWIEEIKRVLNDGILSENYYAMVEASVAGDGRELNRAGETDMEFYRRKQNHIAVRTTSGDQLLARVEVVSPGNKSSKLAIQSFVERAAELIDRGIHLLLLDLFPPGPRDPQGIHGVIWEDICGEEYLPSAGKPLTFAAYEVDDSVRAYVEAIKAGDTLKDMPLFLRPHAHVPVPLEKTYESAFAAVPKRWRAVLEGK